MWWPTPCSNTSGGRSHALFIEEITRVAREAVFIAIPDRFCPVEVHSNIPFLHWLPWWRLIFRELGKAYWASEENLCLFSKRAFIKLLQNASPDIRWEVKRQRLGFVPVSLIAVGRVSRKDAKAQSGQ
jgi:hypothetical protein